MYLRGTTVVTILTSEGIFLGADGKGVYGGTRSASTCKLHVSNNVGFAFTGFAFSDYSHFYASQHAISAIKAGGSIDEIAARFERSIDSPITKALQTIYSTNRAGYDRDFVGKPLLEAIFAQIDRGGALLRYLRFEIVESPSAPPSVSVAQRLRLPEDGLDFMVIGKTSAVEDAHRRGLISSKNIGKDPITAIRMFLKLEIENEPATVGPPISILRLHTGGAEWIERGACTDDNLERER